MREISAKELARNCSEALSRVAFGREHILVTRNGKPMAVLVPIIEQPRPAAPANGAGKAEARP